MKRVTLSLVIVLTLVMTSLLAANLPPIDAQNGELFLECYPLGPITTTVYNATNFSAAASGGVEPYFWSWTVNGTEVASFNNTTATNITYAFNETGLYIVCVNVTDSAEPANERQCCKNVTVVGPSLTIAKIDAPDPVDAGGTLIYTISVNNTGSANATGVTIVDDYDETVLNITDADGGVVAGGTITWNGGLNITAGGSLSYNITANVSPTATGNSTFYNTANVTCAEGVSDFTIIDTRVAVPPLYLECWVSPNLTKVGHVTNFTAEASGGVGNYTWLWTVNGTPAATAQNTTYNFTAAGNYTVCVNVTDSLGNEKQCCTNVTVNPPLYLECLISPNPTKVGHVTNFTAEASGGVGNYTWLWTVNGTEVATTQNTTHTFNETGIYNVCVNVTDSLGNEKQCCRNVTVNDRLYLECVISPNLTKVGHVTNFTAEASGGVPPYTWSWTVNGTEVATTQNTTHTFNATGIYNVCVNVTGSLGNWMECCRNVTVNPALNLTCDVSPNPTKVDHETDFTAEASGGVGNYTWLWTVNGTPVATAQNTTHTFNATGIYNVCVNVTDSLGNEKQCCRNVTVNDRLYLECVISPNPTKVDHVTNFTAEASGGVGNYTWLWTIDGTPAATTQNTTHTFNETGIYNVCVNVTDSLGNERQCCRNVTVNPALSLVLLPATDTNLVGTTHNLTATVYQDDNVMPGVNLTWSISGVGSFSGTPEGITDAYGQAGAVITSSSPGTSTVRCEVTGNTSIYDTATKIWYAEVPPRGGGGGGCPPIKYLTVDWEGRNTTERLRANDELMLDLLGLSPDGCHSLLLEQGTNAPTVDGETYYLITIRELELGDIPPLPEDTIAILAVSITPTGAVFNKDLILTLCFDQLPENALNVTINYYDGVSGVWVPLESTLGEWDGMLAISAPLRHFTVFAVLAELAPTPPPPPAHFVASGLNIVTSLEKIWETVTFVTKTGESVTITADVTNDGGQEGTYTVVLKLDGETVDTEIVALGAGQSQQVSFTVSGMDYGQHEVEVAGLSGEFTTSRTITWWLIIVIIVAIGLIIWGVVWWRRRRRKARQAA